MEPARRVTTRSGGHHPGISMARRSRRGCRSFGTTRRARGVHVVVVALVSVIRRGRWNRPVHFRTGIRSGHDRLFPQTIFIPQMYDPDAAYCCSRSPSTVVLSPNGPIVSHQSNDRKHFYRQRVTCADAHRHRRRHHARANAAANMRCRSGIGDQALVIRYSATRRRTWS